MDRHVGRRLRLARKLGKLTQTDLGAAIGISFQQVQKYETGTSTVGAGKLYQIAGVLGVEPSYFFEELPLQIRFGERTTTMPILQRAGVADLLGPTSQVGIIKFRHTIFPAPRRMVNMAE